MLNSCLRSLQPSPSMERMNRPKGFAVVLPLMSRIGRMRAAVAIAVLSCCFLVGSAVPAEPQIAPLKSWKVRLESWGCAGSARFTVLIKDAGVIQVEVDELPPPGGKSKREHKEVVGQQAARRLLDLAVAAIRSLDVEQSQSRVAGGVNMSLEVEADTVVMFGAAQGLLTHGEAGAAWEVFFVSLNRLLPEDFKVR